MYGCSFFFVGESKNILLKQIENRNIFFSGQVNENLLFEKSQADIFLHPWNNHRLCNVYKIKIHKLRLTCFVNTKLKKI